MEVILQLDSIIKDFPGVRALKGVSFELKAGEIHAIMGENGAGKSTLIKVITGVHQPDGGKIIYKGEEVVIPNSNEAVRMGIAAVYQHATSYPDLSVAENIFLGHQKKKWYGIDWKSMYEDADTYLQQLGAQFNSKAKMGLLSVAQQQMVEIAKALSTNAQVLILDEPTAALSKRECEELYRITKQLKEMGKSIILISHRMEDIYHLADRVTVMRDAVYIGTWNVADVNNDILTKAMIGRELTQFFPQRDVEIGEEVFRAENFTRLGLFQDVGFSVRAGEVLGLAGLVGAGRTEVCQAMVGLDPKDSGDLYINGKKISVKNMREAMNHGIAYLPEDRQSQGLILSWGIYRNISLPVLEKTSNGPWLNEKNEIDLAADLGGKLDIRATGVYDLADSLSGGNQQKVVVAKILAADAKVVILDEATKGVDVGAKYAIYDIINDMAKQGLAVVMISSEMPELLAMSDRIAVMKEGRITGVLNRDEFSQERILQLAMMSEADREEASVE